MRVMRNTITFFPLSKVCFHHNHFFLEATNNTPDLIYCTLFRFNSIGIPDFTELLNLKLSVFSICNFLNQFGKKSPCFWKSHATQTTPISLILKEALIRSAVKSVKVISYLSSPQTAFSGQYMVHKATTNP